MRVFVLCTGRCGSTTFTYACKHMRNFTAGHESRAKFIGPERLEYPDNHIEVDNRLSWFLGRLEQAYGDSAYYVHLTRDAREVAASYARKMDNPASIGAAHKRSILMNSPQDDLEVCVDVVETMRANIEHFLRNKTHVMHVTLENVQEDFARFWNWIGANGDEKGALAEWNNFYNDSETASGAIRPTVPKTELAELRKKYRKATQRFEHADQLHREFERKHRVSEQRYLKLEGRHAKAESRWVKETRRFRSELSDRDQLIAELRTSVDALKASKKRFMTLADEVRKQRDAFVEYSDDLQARYLRVLNSRTWRLFGPYRVLMRKVKGLLLGRPLPPNSLPERPLFLKDNAKRVSPVRNLDKRLWGGFSRPASRELHAFKNNDQEPLKDRSEAAYSLARWHSVQGDFERALEEIRNMRTLYPECAVDPRQFLPEALFLCRLGKAEEARSLLEASERDFNPTIRLMLANTWNPAVAGVSAVEAEPNVLVHLNSIYDHFGLVPVEKRDPDKPLSIDNLRGARPAQGYFDPDGKVTVIIPVFNAEETIVTALISVAEQTWQNLEVLVVDDASTDRSVDIIGEFCTSDSRFRLIRQPRNGGSYLCRNRALEEASGGFITIHDSDDWSHPDKIRCQIEDLRGRPGPYNLAMWVRTTSSLSFFGNSRTLHDLVRPDHSSGLFPRTTFQRFGAWDAVRISADTELYWRIENALGNKKWMFNRRQVLKGCPLSFGRMSDTSLTQSGPTSVMTIYHGIRREYRDAADFWHSRQEGFSDPSPRTRRKPFFPVPPMMDPTGESGIRLSALLVADWNSGDSLLHGVMQILQSQPRDDNVRFGLLHYPRYESDVSAPLSQQVRGFAWDNAIRVVAPGEAVEADVVLVLTPRVFEHAMDRLPTVAPRRLVVMDGARPDAETTVDGDGHDSETVRTRLAECFGHEGEWVQSLEDFSCVMVESGLLPGLNQTREPMEADARTGFV